MTAILEKYEFVPANMPEINLFAKVLFGKFIRIDITKI
jgi:hypothetical protein